MNKDEIVKLFYDASLIMLGAVATGVVSKKVFKTDLGVRMSGYAILKMAGAIASGTAIVNYLEQKKYIPSNISKKKKKNVLLNPSGWVKHPIL